MKQDQWTERRRLVTAILAATTIASWILTARRSGDLWETYDVGPFLLNLALTYITLCCLYVVTRLEQRRIRVFRVLLLTASLVLTIGVLELPVVLSKFDYGNVVASDPESTWLQLSRHVNRPDSELIHIHYPYDEYSGRVRGNLVRRLGIPDPPWHEVELKYDGNGFRNSSDLEQADIVAVGDSFLEAALIDENEVVTSRIQSRLDVPVANLGQSNYGLKQELAVLRRFGLPLRPKVVWFFFGGNDMNVEFYDWQQANFERLTKARPLKHRLLTRNSLLALSSLTSPRRSQPSKKALNHRGVFTLDDGSKDYVYFGTSNGPWKNSQWDVAIATLAEANSLCKNSDARFVVVYISRKYRIYKDDVQFEPGANAEDWDVNDLPDAMNKWCDQESIPFINTIPVLKKALGKGQHVHFPDDVHWNAAGHRIVADLIAEFLKSNSWIADPETIAASLPSNQHVGLCWGTGLKRLANTRSHRRTTSSSGNAAHSNGR